MLMSLLFNFVWRQPLNSIFISVSVTFTLSKVTELWVITVCCKLLNRSKYDLEKCWKKKWVCCKSLLSSVTWLLFKEDNFISVISWDKSWNVGLRYLLTFIQAHCAMKKSKLLWRLITWWIWLHSKSCIYGESGSFGHLFFLCDAWCNG